MTQKGLKRFLARLSLSDEVEQESGSDRELVAAPVTDVRPPYRLPGLVSNFTQDTLDKLIRESQDYQIVHGGLLKRVLQNPEPPCASARVVGVALHPSPFPRRLFEEACQLQTIIHELCVAILNHPEWLGEVLKDLIATDPLTKTLWSVFERTKLNRSRNDAAISAGIFRSDYMVHAEAGSGLRLKQVELNTIACAGSVHGQRVSNMHRHLHETGVYCGISRNGLDNQRNSSQITIPTNDNVASISSMLAVAHNAYVRQHQGTSPSSHRKTCILMVVQPHNFNIADERPIEYALWSQSPPIACFRLEWGEDLLEFTNVDVSGSLLFSPPYISDVYEVSVVYFRAGFEPHEFVERLGYDARLRLETSSAVKIPDILTHLIGLKKVQQALCIPGTVERFIDAKSAARLRKSFMQMYPLDSSDLGNEGRRLATNSALSRNYVLKPSRDGGGHNIYREDIVSFLQQLPGERWPEYVLMEMIKPVVARNVLVSSRGLWVGDVVAELGIWGAYVWQRKQEDAGFLANKHIGWSVRSKNPQIDEMSVVKGYGCFDSIMLVDHEMQDVDPL